MYWIHFQNKHTFMHQKTLLHTLFSLVFKIVEILQYILNYFNIFGKLSPWGKISKTAMWWLFSFTDKANEIISLALSSGELMNLTRSLVPVCEITRSGFFLSQGLYNVSWLYKNFVITATFICNRFFMQIFHCWISCNNCARSFYAVCWDCLAL